MATVFISAGEASGDYHGAKLAAEIKARDPSVRLVGMGGDRMAEAGVELWHHIRDLNVMGLAFLPHLKKILGIKRDVEKRLADLRPDRSVFIDFPEFNLRVAKKAKSLRLNTTYYIPPKIWAWRKGRARTIRRVIDQLLVIFPFEVDFYRQLGIKAQYVGNPLADDCVPRETFEVAKPPCIGLVPGSRRGEVKSLLPHLIDAAQIMRERFPGIRLVLPAASSISDEELAPAMAAGVEVLRRPLPEVLKKCDYAWVASGTASLEAALTLTPMCIFYRVNPVTFAIGSRLVGVSFIGLPNILAEKEVVPEFLQDDANGRKLADEATNVLSDTRRRDAMIENLKELRRLLGEKGAAGRAAEAVLATIGKTTNGKTSNL